jgi:asparagine synthase (glutamine-hydrolysing)
VLKFFLIQKLTSTTLKLLEAKGKSRFMCGICGIIYKDPARPVSMRTLENMAHQIIHRGPDDEGYFLDRNFGMASRRLSIIDIDGGHQPFSNEDNSVIAVFNGEIYNHTQLRKDLQQKGHIFRSKCDTEVLVHLYEEHGNRMAEHLNGMFAFCIYDRRSGKYLLVRDRLGIKPLYYIDTEKWILFGSEIKSFFCYPEFYPKLDYQAFHYYLTFRFVPTPLTIYEGLKKCPPGCMVEYQNSRRTVFVSEYWDINFSGNLPPVTLAQASEEVSFLVQDSVDKRMMSEVPLGAMLSGGVDSSAIVASMKNGGKSKISTFTVGYEEEGDHNEGTYASLVADEFDTDHHEKIICSSDFLGELDNMVYHMDEPVADPSAIPILDLCRYSRKFVKVLLSGVGGDELFAGYKGYRESVYYTQLKSLPKFFWKYLIDPYYNRMPQNTWGKNFSKRIREPIENGFLGSSFHYGGFSEAEKTKMYTGDLTGTHSFSSSHDLVRKTLGKIPEASRLNKMLYLDIKHWLADSHLIMMDKMSMANSVELRTPLLDHRLVEFAAALPQRFKINFTESKIIFKEAFKSKIPEQILKRRKRGFSTPLNMWIQSSKDEILSLLIDRNGVLNELFDNNELISLVDEHLDTKSDQTAKIFTLLVYQIWAKKFKPSLN